MKRLVFFSGGTALAGLARHMAKLHIPSSHLVSMFDSGGSTAELRRVFAMPAVGDLRNRLLALADPSIDPRIIQFCGHRLAEKASPGELRAELAALADLSARHWEEMPKDCAHSLWLALHYFLRFLTGDFNLSGACIGNLMIAGIYLRRNKNLGSALAMLGQVLKVCGSVLPITETSAHLCAKLADGTVILGQHEFHALPAPVKEPFLSVHESLARLESGPEEIVACHPAINPEASRALGSASLICFPVGSFYSSILANLLVCGTGQAVAKSCAKKVFIPNSGLDVELFGRDIAQQARMILDELMRDSPGTPGGEFLQYVLIDSQNGVYPGGLGPNVLNALGALGLKLIDRPLVDNGNPKRHVPELLLNALLELSS